LLFNSFYIKTTHQIRAGRTTTKQKLLLQSIIKSAEDFLRKDCNACVTPPYLLRKDLLSKIIQTIKTENCSICAATALGFGYSAAIKHRTTQRMLDGLIKKSIKFDIDKNLEKGKGSN
jgi:hypothetical protein